MRCVGDDPPHCAARSQHFSDGRHSKHGQSGRRRRWRDRSTSRASLPTRGARSPRGGGQQRSRLGLRVTRSSMPWLPGCVSRPIHVSPRPPPPPRSLRFAPPTSRSAIRSLSFVLGVCPSPDDTHHAVRPNPTQTRVTSAVSIRVSLLASKSRLKRAEALTVWKRQAIRGRRTGGWLRLAEGHRLVRQQRTLLQRWARKARTRMAASVGFGLSPCSPSSHGGGRAAAVMRPKSAVASPTQPTVHSSGAPGGYRPLSPCRQQLAPTMGLGHRPPLHEMAQHAVAPPRGQAVAAMPLDQLLDRVVVLKSLGARALGP